MRRIAVLIAAFVAIGTIGVFAARGGGQPSADPEAPTTTASAGTAVAAGATPSGPDLAAARAAGVRAVALTGDVVRAGFISRRELIESFTTVEYGPTLADDTSTSVNAMLLELGQRDVDPASLAVVEQPVTATAQATPEGVIVQVWSVLVVAAPGAGPGRQVWRTVTLDMAGVDGRWLVDGWSSTPGPSPAPPAEGVVDDAVAFAEPMSWPTATGSAAGGD